MCSACFLCTDEPGEACRSERLACDAVSGCSSVATCFLACETNGECIDDCCENSTDEAVTAAGALSECHKMACAGPNCFDFPMPICSGG